jgi:hypothetical protein
LGIGWLVVLKTMTHASSCSLFYFRSLSDFHPAFNRNNEKGCHEITRKKESQGLLGGVNPRASRKRQGSAESGISDHGTLDSDHQKPSARTIQSAIEIESDDDAVVDDMLSTISAGAGVNSTAALAGAFMYRHDLPQVNRILYHEQGQQPFMESNTSAKIQLNYLHLNQHHDTHCTSQEQEQVGLGVTVLYPIEHKLRPLSIISSLSQSPYPHPLESYLEPRTIEEMMKDPDSTSVGNKNRNNKADKLKHHATDMEKTPRG